ncbi:MAG: hypothetical protein HY231_05160 [Acidobacteria bacterium]|nr:hypothetical protein [Acidobacteriota bacterium]
MKILVVAALPREIAPLLRLRLKGVEALVTGEGRHNAARALRQWLEKNSAAVILGVGFAGALSAKLAIGDVVMDQEARLGASLFEKINARHTLSKAQPATAPDAAAVAAATASVEIFSALHLGRIITVDEILNAKGKGELAATLPQDDTACVEMEAAALAEVCQENQLPLLSVRAISDLLAEDFPLDFNACRNSDGRVSTAKIMRQVLRQPQAIRGLLQLHRRTNLCAARLAAFVEQALPILRASVQEQGVERWLGREP